MLQLGGRQTGGAKITKGCRLKARDIIHTVGPVCFRQVPERATGVLVGAYCRSPESGCENTIHSVAFPCISAGANGYPIGRAVPIALWTVVDYLDVHPDIELARFVLLGYRAHETYERTLECVLA